MVQKSLKQIICMTFLAGLVFPVTVCSATQHKLGQAVVLARNGKSGCRIVADSNDQIAAKSLQDYLRKRFKIETDIVSSSDAVGVGQMCEILLGTRKTNPYLAQVARKHKVELEPESLTVDGYVLRTLRDQQQDIVLVAGGGKRGVFYAVGELKNYYLRQIADSVVVLPASVREVPTLKYRWFWTWDWRMEWGGVEPGGSKMAGGGSYRKKPESFMADYKACIDYMSENGFNGLIIWGFIRDTHGGVTASQELCRYAAERGVRVLPGVGTSGYAGYVFEGNHRYNARTWLKQHPQLRSITKDGKLKQQGADGLTDHLCPSNKANQDWLDEGAKWLFENFQIGGVNLEMGDFFVCYCDDCRRARTAIKSDEPDYYKDMAISHRVTLKTMRQLAPNAWLSYATYTGFTREMMTKPPKFIEMITSDAICQWTLTRMIAKNQWSADLKPMAGHNIGYLHWANKSTHTEHDFFLERLRAAAAKSHRAGLEGLGLYGELSDSWLNMALNYLAFKEFCFHPDLSRDAFTKKRLAPLYGEELTADLWKIINLVRTAKQRKSAENITEALGITESALDRAAPHTRANWQAIIVYLKSFLPGTSAKLSSLY